MTLPVERMRSLRWGLELLQAMLADPSLPAPMRLRTQSLLPRYPTPDQLRRLLAEGVTGLPDELCAAIDDAADLFQDLRLGEWGSAELRRHQLYVLRHFPSRGTAPRPAVRFITDGLWDWIELEDDFRP
jgi:hypothetical protein